MSERCTENNCVHSTPLCDKAWDLAKALDSFQIEMERLKIPVIIDFDDKETIKILVKWRKDDG